MNILTPKIHLGLKKGISYIGITQPTLKLGPTMDFFFFMKNKNKEMQ